MSQRYFDTSHKIHIRLGQGRVPFCGVLAGVRVAVPYSDINRKRLENYCKRCLKASGVRK